jgi:hypothetical protein
MTKQRHSKRLAYTWIAMGLIVVGVIALTGAGRRESARSASGSSAAPAAAPSGEITPGVAHADVDTLDLQLD